MADEDSTHEKLSKAGQKGAKEQPREAKVEGGKKSPTSGSTDAAKRGGENSRGGSNSNNE